MTAPPQRTKTKIAFTALLPAAQVAMPQAQAPKQEKKHGFEIPKRRIDLGLFVPSDGKTRRRFGKTCLRFTASGSAVAGTTVGASGFAEIKYLAISQVKGFDLSGTSFTAGIRF